MDAYGSLQVSSGMRGQKFGECFNCSHNCVQCGGKLQPEKKTTDPTDLAAKWGVGLEVERCILDCTTQRGLRTVLHPYLKCRLQMNDRQLQYRRLRHDFFGDTLLARTNSKRGNKDYEVFVTNFVWLCAFHIAKRGDLNESLSLFFHRDGVPPNMIVDSSKDHTLVSFKHNFAEADCHLSQTEPESPWQMATEAEIC